MYIDGIEIKTGAIDDEITRLHEDLARTQTDTEDYATLIDQIAKLYNLKKLEYEMQTKVYDQATKQKESDSNCRVRDAEAANKQAVTEQLGRVSKETLALLGANILGIILVLNHERARVITTKAFGLVSRMR